MKAVITGGSGFLGAKLAEAILRKGHLRDSHGEQRQVDELVIVDIHAPAHAWARDPRVRFIAGDLSDPAFLRTLVAQRFDSLFHFAAVLKAAADRDLGAAVRFNVLGFTSLLEGCREAGFKPKLFFASSVGVFENGMREAADDARHHPSSSYGAHKAIGELLIDDFSRSGAIDGRGLRFPIAMTRPAPSPTVSDAISAIVRGAVRGQDVVCPLDPALRMPVTSAAAAAEATLAVHDLPAEQLGNRRTHNMPCPSVTLAEVAAAAARQAAANGVACKLTWQPEAGSVKVFVGRPERIEAAWAAANRIPGDADIDAIVEHFAAEEAGRSASGHSPR